MPQLLKVYEAEKPGSASESKFARHLEDLVRERKGETALMDQCVQSTLPKGEGRSVVAWGSCAFEVCDIPHACVAGRYLWAQHLLRIWLCWSLFRAHLIIRGLVLNLCYLMRQSALPARDKALFARLKGWVLCRL